MRLISCPIAAEINSSDQGNHLARSDVERHVIQRLPVTGKGLAEPVDCDRRHGSGAKVLRIMP